jgi:hypothetical protein
MPWDTEKSIPTLAGVLMTPMLMIRLKSPTSVCWGDNDEERLNVPLALDLELES